MAMTRPRRDAAGRCAEAVRVARELCGAEMSATGLIVRCYAEAGVALPDDLLELHLAGEKILGSDLLPADLIFRTGRQDLYHGGDRRYGVGHVGLYTGDRTVVHASPAKGHVAEDPIDPFFDDEYGRFRGVRRIIVR